MPGKDEMYYNHQTPTELAVELLKHVSIEPGDRVYEPFKGEGAFYDAYPDTCVKDYSEIQEGKDYAEYKGTYDWVITNPPFRLDTGDKRINGFWYLLDYFTKRATKGVAFLVNDKCWSGLTPNRYNVLKERGFFISKIIICSIKKWRGRYYFLVVEKKPSNVVDCLLKAY